MSTKSKLTLTRICLLGSILLFLFLFFASAENTKQLLWTKYNDGIDKITEGDFQGAIDTLDKLGDYKDSQKYIELTQDYEKAINLFDQGSYDEAYKLFLELDDFQDSKTYATKVNKLIEDRNQKIQLYAEACDFYESEDFAHALEKFKELGDYEESERLAQTCEIMLTRLKLSTTISAGIRYSTGVTKNGTAVVSGDFSGKSDIEDWTDIVSISGMGEFIIGLTKNGKTVTAKGQPQYAYDYRIDTSEWNDIVEVSAGEQYIIGLRSNGTLTAQGIDGYGETEIDSWKNIVDISTAWQLTVGLDSTGEIHVTGRNSRSLLEAIEHNKEKWTNIIAVSAGGGKTGIAGERGHIVALKSDGTVVAVGDNSKGQCNVDEWEDIVAISAGAYHTVGLKSDGTVISTLNPQSYENSYQEINSWNNIVAISAGYGLTLALDSDGRVWTAGYDRQGQSDTDSWESIALRDEWISCSMATTSE